MRIWDLINGDPLCLTLSADYRLGQIDPTNDHTWELLLPGGEPAALALQTSYGLRARWMRLFPVFSRKGAMLTDPRKFHAPPRLVSFSQNTLNLAFSPYPNLEVTAEYWVPDSNQVCGRLKIKNRSVLKERLRLDWAAVLNPLGEGCPMTSLDTHSAQPALQGCTGDLFPTLLLSGSAQVGSDAFPSLTVEMELFPGNHQSFTWALASLADPDAALAAAQAALTQRWDAELARLDLSSSAEMVQIFTGDEDWDAALALAQVAARRLIFPASTHLAAPTFVLSRQPDDGYSANMTSSDTPFHWAGQTALESLYLASFLLPGSADVAEGLLRNFIATQNETGHIDWKPGLTDRLAQPVLSTLAWQIDQYRCDHTWLQDIYPALLRFVKAWFTPENDRDADGFPEWSHPLQTGLEHLPLYDRWQTQAQGVEISTLESPALAAFLLRECQSLAAIARRIGITDDLLWLQAHSDTLAQALEANWDAKAGTYRHRDAVSHLSTAGGEIKTLSGPGSHALRRTFKTPTRLLIHLSSASESTRSVHISLTGEGPGGEQTEELATRAFYWTSGHATATSHLLYTSLSKVIVAGLFETDEITLSRPDMQQDDLTLLLPLWAGVPSPERTAQMLDGGIYPRMLRQFGISLCPPGEYTSPWPDGVSTLWNSLICEGLLNANQPRAALDLYTRQMGAVLENLRQRHSFFAAYHAETGQPVGERNHLHGLPSPGLFLRLLGIRINQANSVILQGNHLFPRPVTVKYQGMVIHRSAAESSVTFSTGQTIRVTGPGPHLVSLSERETRA